MTNPSSKKEASSGPTLPGPAGAVRTREERRQTRTPEMWQKMADGSMRFLGGGQPVKPKPPVRFTLRTDDETAAAIGESTIFGPDADIWKLNDDPAKGCNVVLSGSRVVHARIKAPADDHEPATLLDCWGAKGGPNDTDVFCTEGAWEKVVDWVAKATGCTVHRPNENAAKVSNYNIFKCENPEEFVWCYDLPLLRGFFACNKDGKPVVMVPDRLVLTGRQGDDSRSHEVIGTPETRERVEKYVKRGFAATTVLDPDSDAAKERWGWSSKNEPAFRQAVGAPSMPAAAEKELMDFHEKRDKDLREREEKVEEALAARKAEIQAKGEATERMYEAAREKIERMSAAEIKEELVKLMVKHDVLFMRVITSKPP